MSDFSVSSSTAPNLNGHHAPVNRVQPASFQIDAARNGEINAVGLAPAAAADGDRVEVSNFARYLAHLRQLPEVRHDRVDRVRESITSENYETEEKYDVAIERWAREEL